MRIFVKLDDQRGSGKAAKCPSQGTNQMLDSRASDRRKLIDAKSCGLFWLSMLERKVLIEIILRGKCTTAMIANRGIGEAGGA